MRQQYNTKSLKSLLFFKKMRLAFCLQCFSKCIEEKSICFSDRNQVYKRRTDLSFK